MSTFEALYAGRCISGDAIEVGDEILYDVDGNLSHVDCDAEELAKQTADAKRETCPACWILMPCGC